MAKPGPKKGTINNPEGINQYSKGGDTLAQEVKLDQRRISALIEAKNKQADSFYLSGKDKLKVAGATFLGSLLGPVGGGAAGIVTALYRKGKTEEAQIKAVNRFYDDQLKKLNKKK